MTLSNKRTTKALTRLRGCEVFSRRGPFYPRQRYVWYIVFVVSITIFVCFCLYLLLLSHLSQRLRGELIEYSGPNSPDRQHFQNISGSNVLNGMGERKYIREVLVRQSQTVILIWRPDLEN